MFSISFGTERAEKMLIFLFEIHTTVFQRIIISKKERSRAHQKHSNGNSVASSASVVIVTAMSYDLCMTKSYDKRTDS